MFGKDKLIEGSRLAVRTGLIVNWAFGAAVVVGLIVSLTIPKVFTALLIQPAPGADVRSATAGLRCLLLVGLVMFAAIDRLFAALAQIIASARAGDPFIPVNARRLRTIGWALLTLQLLNLPNVLIERSFPGLGTAAPSGFPFSPGAWLSILMVFVLSRVFAVGSAMRDELEGTV